MKINPQQKYPNIRSVILISLLFMWVYTPMFCAENLLSDIMRKNGFESLGFILLGTMFLFQMIGAFFAPSIRQKIGLTWSFVLGCFALSFFVFIQILPAWRQDKASEQEEGQSF